MKFVTALAVLAVVGSSAVASSPPEDGSKHTLNLRGFPTFDEQLNDVDDSTKPTLRNLGKGKKGQKGQTGGKKGKKNRENKTHSGVDGGVQNNAANRSGSCLGKKPNAVPAGSGGPAPPPESWCEFSDECRSCCCDGHYMGGYKACRDADDVTKGAGEKSCLPNRPVSGTGGLGTLTTGAP